jgi:glycolate oxidase
MTAIGRESVLRDLESMLSTELVLTASRGSIEDYLKDMGDFPSEPLAIVQPKSVAQVSAVLKYANDNRIPVVARGAGTSLTGATSTFGGLVLDFSKNMNRILTIDTTNWFVHCEAGVVLDDLNAELKKLGFFFPPDPSSTPWCTVGGVIAENSGGMRTFRYGTVKNWVLALTVVLADGTVAKLGEPLPKNRVGYDLVHLVCGSEGTLAVITDAWLKITPLPEEAAGSAMRRFMVFFSTWKDAVNSIVGIRSSRLIPNLLEFIDGEAMKAINDSFELGIPVHEAILFMESSDEMIPKILAICNSNGCIESYIAKDDKDGERLHSGRALLLLGIKALDSGVYNEDTVVPLDRLADYIAYVKLTAKKYGLRIPVGGHAGDGNVHPTIVFHKESKESIASADLAFRDLCEYAVTLGGSVTGEHGIGIQKLPYARHQLLERNGARVIELMRAVKQIWDPSNILNPGKFLVEDSPQS